MNNKNNLITGITDMLVLAILEERGDSYVYDISKLIARESKEKLVISQNTVYTVMYKLEKENMISEYSVLVGKRRTRIYYRIEPAGKKYLHELQTTYNNMVTGVKYILDSLVQEETADE